MIAAIPDEVLISVNTLELVGIVYLAVAISALRERLSHMEGKNSQRERDNGK